MEIFAKLFGACWFLYITVSTASSSRGTCRLDPARADRAFLPRRPGRSDGRQEVLGQRTNEYRAWVEATPATTRSPSSGPRKACARRTTSGPICARWSGRPHGVYFIFKSMEMGRRFAHRAQVPDPGSELSHPGRRSSAGSRTTTSTSGRGLRPDGHVRGHVLPFQTTYYLNGHTFIERN